MEMHSKIVEDCSEVYLPERVVDSDLALPAALDLERDAIEHHDQVVPLLARWSAECLAKHITPFVLHLAGQISVEGESRRENAP